MVRFLDKTAITTINGNDILPITDVDDSNNDKKISISQLNTYFSTNLTTFAKTDLSNTNMLTDAIIVAPNGVIVANSANTAVIAKSGMQLLFANGRQSDGSFNSISYTLSANVTQSIITLSDGDYVMFLTNNGTLTYTLSNQVYVSRTQPTVTTSTAYWYDIATNYWKRSTNTGASWSNITINALGQFTVASALLTKVVSNTVAYIPNAEALMVRDVSNITEQGKENLKSYVEITDRANISLSNLNSTGEAHFVKTAQVDSAISTAVSTLLSTLYPVGSIYIGTQSTCPLSSLISGSTWTKIEGRYLLASGTIDGTSETISANDTLSAGLPNITGWISNQGLSYGNDNNSSGALYGTARSDYGVEYRAQQNGQIKINIDASRSSSIYSQSATVRPTAYGVNVWRRTV